MASLICSVYARNGREPDDLTEKLLLYKSVKTINEEYILKQLSVSSSKQHSTVSKYLIRQMLLGLTCFLARAKTNHRKESAESRTKATEVSFQWDK